MINPQMITQVKRFLSDPLQMIQQMGIPQEYMNNPSGMIQKLMNEGMITQAQYNQLQQTTRQIQSMLN